MRACPDHPLPYAHPASVWGHHLHPSRSCSSILSLRGSLFGLRYALSLGTCPRSNLDLLIPMLPGRAFATNVSQESIGRLIADESEKGRCFSDLSWRTSENF